MKIWFKVVTMHRSKGLEYPIVFCPFLWKGPKFSDEGAPLVFHDDGGETTILDFNGKQDPARDRKRYKVAEEELAESIRLAYVAITRAKHQCVISWVHASKTEVSPLGYLLLGADQSLGVLKNIIASGRKYKALDSALFEKALAGLKEQHSRHFAITYGSSAGQQQLLLQQEDSPTLEARAFVRSAPLENGYTVSSFSSITRSKHAQGDNDYLLYFDEPLKADQPRPENTKKTVFSFPRGPNPGTAVHHIFESIDFNISDNWDTAIAEHLAKQSISLEWIPVARQLVQAALSKKLLPDEPEFCLNQINPGDRIPELEFYLSSANVQLQKLLEIIRPGGNTEEAVEGFAEEGYLKGFIDFTFRYDGRYYILDYKTNYLGDSIADYNRAMLQQEMYEAFYDLQYHLYCVALHRFLKSRLKDYTYESHFGGAFYLFYGVLIRKGMKAFILTAPIKS